MSLLDFFRKRTGPAGPEDEILEQLRQLDDEEFFLRLCEAVRRSGYTVDHHGMSSNGGDMVLRRRGERTWLRYRLRHARRVGVAPVRELYRFSQEQGAAGCKFVTCGVFDARAQAFVRDKPIQLLGGPVLLEAMPSLLTPAPRDGAPSVLGRAFVPREHPEHHASPSGSDASPTTGSVPSEESHLASEQEVPLVDHNCPRCGAPMQLHMAGDGNAAGHRFWACTRRPDCRGTRPA